MLFQTLLVPNKFPAFWTDFCLGTKDFSWWTRYSAPRDISNVRFSLYWTTWRENFSKPVSMLALTLSRALIPFTVCYLVDKNFTDYSSVPHLTLKFPWLQYIYWVNLECYPLQFTYTIDIKHSPISCHITLYFITFIDQNMLKNTMLWWFMVSILWKSAVLRFWKSLNHLIKITYGKCPKLKNMSHYLSNGMLCVPNWLTA